MYRKPNEDILNAKKNDSNKRNLLGRKFSEIFEILMDPGYYEGTKYANYFNRLNEDGTSRIYVYDPLEEELKKLIHKNKNQMKYLVGLTGMGKTTLLRNFFRITDRDVKIEGNRIIIYISFYYAHLYADNPQKSVENEVIQYFARTVKVLLGQNTSLIENEEVFWLGFYRFLEGNKAPLLEIEDLSPGSQFIQELTGNKTYQHKLNQLKMVCEKKPVEYYSSFIKYILKQLEQKYHIILIYDDIESKEGIFHRPLVEVARHVHSCFCAIEDKERTIKTIVALRAYTFRSNIGRQSDARREYLQNDTILKKETVSLHDIFEKRFQEIEEVEEIANRVKNYDSYTDAKKQLKYVEQRLDNLGSNLIYNLSNYNLCDAMILYCSVMTNIEWIACNEIENKGSFVIDSKNYQLTTENLIYAIANGNSKEYMNQNGSFVPNILDNSTEGTDLIGLYIIRYLTRKKITNIYGEKYAEGQIILSELMGLFVNNTDSEARIDRWRYRILHMLEYLYDSGILFRSLHDIEDTVIEQTERQYNNNFKLYLSPRGKCLYSLLSKNAVLLELYRDDIYTNLKYNDILTNELNTIVLFDYLLEYIEETFLLEKKNIASANFNLEKYQELLGNEFITIILLEGIVKNLGAYFKNSGEEYDDKMRKVYQIRKDMLEYASLLEEKCNARFMISNYILSV